MREELEPILFQAMTNKKIGFFISGGFDSMVLLFFCCLLKKEHSLNTEFKIFTVPRYDDSEAHSNRVIDYISKKLNMKFDVNLVGNPDLHHSIQVFSGIRESLKLVDSILLGDTKNPEHLPNGPLRVKSTTKRVVQPFFQYTKKDTVELAIKLDIIKEISSLSHTCTQSNLLRCNQCWQCRERAWGFSQNNYTDIGTM